MELTQEELQNIRHLIGSSSNLVKKMDYYCTSVSDENACNILQKIKSTAMTTKESICQKL